MVNNPVVLSGLMASSANIALWVVAAVLLVIIVVRRKARKA
jgi:hypothetical protein